LVVAYRSRDHLDPDGQVPAWVVVHLAGDDRLDLAGLFEDTNVREPIHPV
jgi:hypothetical protein